MLRLSILQSVNGAVLKLNINDFKPNFNQIRFLTKCMNNLNTSNGIVETKDTSTLQDTTDSDIDGDVHKQIKNKLTTKNKKAELEMQQGQHEHFKLSETNELESVNKFKVMVNIKSVPIFGSETVENSELQCIEDNEDLEIPTVAHILSETLSPTVKAALERWKKNMIDIYGEDHFKTCCKGITFVR